MHPAFEHKFIAVTGASSGIGEAVARHLAEIPCTLILMGRSVERLKGLQEELGPKKALIHILPLDLEDPKSIDEAISGMTNLIPQLDWLFNIGGVSQRSLAAETSISVVRRIMEINFIGTVQLSLGALELMKSSNAPGLVLTSSMVGLFGYPERSAYSASKHALQGYFESMQLEVDKPSITIVSPGSIKTRISYKALLSDGTENQAADPRLEEGMTAESAAKKILIAASKRKRSVYIGKRELLMIYFHRYLPFLFRSIAKRTTSN